MGDDGQFQYIKLPDGSYGKFAADASDDFIRSAVQRDFPGSIRPSYADQVRNRPKVQAPPMLRKTESGAAVNTDWMTSPEEEGDRLTSALGGALADSAKESAKSMARTSGPNVVYQGLRRATGHQPTGLGMPTPDEAMTTGLTALAGGMLEGAPAAGAGGGMSRMATATRSAEVPPIRPNVPAAGSPSPSPSIGSDLLDVARATPYVGTKVRGAEALGRLTGLLKRAPKLSDTAAPGETGGWMRDPAAEASSLQQKQFGTGNTAAGRSVSMEANPPDQPLVTHTPSGGARQTLQRSPEGKFLKKADTRLAAGEDVTSTTRPLLKKKVGAGK